MMRSKEIRVATATYPVAHDELDSREAELEVIDSGNRRSWLAIMAGQPLSSSGASNRASDLVPDSDNGGPHTSRTIMLKEFSTLLSASSLDAARADYAEAVVEENVLSKKSDSTRKRSLRYLRELYVLDSTAVLFRGLRDLWSADPESLPLLALVCALARDPLLRATGPPLFEAPFGAPVDASMLAEAVIARFPQSYSEAVAAKIGRNTASSWTQSGHLKGRVNKTRVRAQSTPAAVTYAFMVGHLANARGQGLLRTVWGQSLDSSDHEMYQQAIAASKRGWMEFRRAGDVVEVGFRWLLRPSEG